MHAICVRRLHRSYRSVWSMPLSAPLPRSMRHRRAITVEAYLREDGLWDIEARLTDTKPRDIPLASGGVRPEIGRASCRERV